MESIPERKKSDSFEKTKTFLEVVKRVQKLIPKDESNKVPSDASENLDHYLYGGPKGK